MTETLTTPIGEMWLDDSGLLWHRLDGSLEITREDALEVVRCVRRLTGGRLVPAIVDIRSVAYAPHEARTAFAGSPEESSESATALIVQAGASSAMAKVFTSVTKPKRPVAVFEDEDEAVAWAMTFHSEPSS
jgi:hypothetical protein